MNGSFPGSDAKGNKDPSSIVHMVFAAVADRDAWTTAQGGAAAIPDGFMCFIKATNMLNVMNGGVWKTSVALT